MMTNEQRDRLIERYTARIMSMPKGQRRTHLKRIRLALAWSATARNINRMSREAR
jgi:hypothetical protein